MLAIFLFISFGGSAQDQGNAQFLVDVDNGYFEILVDDTIYLKIYKCTLPVGAHHAKIWSPGYITTEVNFEVKKDETTKTYVQMAISNNRQEFERQYKEYRMRFHKSLTLPLSITLATTLISGTFMLKAYDSKKKIYGNIDQYHKAPNYLEANSLSQSISENNRIYNRQRILFYSTLGLSAAALGTTIYTYTMFKRNNTEPKLNAESPFKDRFSLHINPFGGTLIWRLG